MVSREIQPDGEPGGYIHHYLDRQIHPHEDLLAGSNLVYMCGLAGMQLGVFKMMAERGLGFYLKVKPDYAESPPPSGTATRSGSTCGRRIVACSSLLIGAGHCNG